MVEPQDHSHTGFETIVEAVGELYTGKVVQVYFGETGGSTHYSDYDIEQKIYAEGEVLWAKGNVMCLRCKVETPSSTHYENLLINGWAITSVMEKSKSNVSITHVMQQLRR